MRGAGGSKMGEFLFISLEIVGAVFAATFFVIECVRQEAAVARRVAVVVRRRSR